MINNISIEIQYLINNSPELKSYQLSPNDYFDLEENEAIEIDCCPKYSHACEYIKEKDNSLVNDILFTKILLTDLGKKEHRQITEKFWNKGQNRIIERIDIDLIQFKIIYNEIIIETLINVNPNKWEIIRLERNNQIMQPIFHSFIEDNNGQEKEQQIIIDSHNYYHGLVQSKNNIIKEQLNI